MRPPGSGTLNALLGEHGHGRQTSGILVAARKETDRSKQKCSWTHTTHDLQRS